MSVWVLTGLVLLADYLFEEHGPRLRHWWRERRIARGRARAVNEYVKRVRSS